MMKKSRALLSMLVAFVMTFAMVVPTSLMQAYAADDGLDVKITIKKNLTGKTLKAGDFKFELWNWADTEKVADATGKSEVTNDANGEATFTVHFDGPTNDGGVGYYVREVKGNDPDMTYDEEHKHVVINVSEETVSGTGGGDMVGVNNYTPKKKNAAGEKVNYDRGGDEEAGWYSEKTVTDNESTEHVFCGVNYKLSGNKDVNAAPGLLRFKSTGIANRESYLQALKDWEKTKYPTWLDMVAFLYSYDWFKHASGNGMGSGPEANGALTEEDKGEVLTGADLEKAVKRVLYNGYPYNVANVKDVNGLRKTTQEALFFIFKYGYLYKNNMMGIGDSDFRPYAPNTDDFDALVNYAVKGEKTSGYSLKEAPNDLEVYVHIRPAGINAADGIPGFTEAFGFNAQPLIGVYCPNQGDKKLVCNDEPVVTFNNSYTGKEDSKGSLATTVSCDGSSASADKAAEVKVPAGGATKDVVDKIDYKGLTAGATYTVSGSLWEVKDGKTVGDKSVATASEEIVADKADGTWEIKFKNVILEPGKSYVVFEEAVNKADKKDKAEHKNPEDTHQTIVVTEEPSDDNVTVKISKTDMGGNEVAGAEIVVSDSEGNKVYSWTSTKDVHEIKVKPGTYTLEETNAPEGYQKVTTKIEFEVAADGTVTVKTTKVEPAGACVFEDGILVLKDAIDKSSDIKLATQVENQYISPAANQSFTDTVTFEGLEEGKTYTIKGVVKNQKDESDVAAECEPAEVDSSINQHGMQFRGIDASKFNDGDKLVVFEYLYEGTIEETKDFTPGDGNDVAKHEDLTDVAQTVTIVDGQIKLEKTTAATSVKPGDVVPYTITVTNERKVPATVQIVDNPETGLKYVEASDGGAYDSDVNTVVWDGLEVPANGSVSVDVFFSITEDASGKVTNRAHVFEPENPDNVLGAYEDASDVKVLGAYDDSTDNGSNKKSKGANTGDDAPLGIAMIVLLAAAGGFEIIRRRRTN